MADFGLSRLKDTTFASTTNVHAGTAAYMAPELFEGRQVSEKVSRACVCGGGEESMLVRTPNA